MLSVFLMWGIVYPYHLSEAGSVYGVLVLYSEKEEVSKKLWWLGMGKKSIRAYFVPADSHDAPREVDIRAVSLGDGNYYYLSPYYVGKLTFLKFKGEYQVKTSNYIERHWLDVPFTSKYEVSVGKGEIVRAEPIIWLILDIKGGIISGYLLPLSEVSSLIEEGIIDNSTYEDIVARAEAAQERLEDNIESAFRGFFWTDAFKTRVEVEPGRVWKLSPEVIEKYHLSDAVWKGFAFEFGMSSRPMLPRVSSLGDEQQLLYFAYIFNTFYHADTLNNDTSLYLTPEYLSSNRTSVDTEVVSLYYLREKLWPMRSALKAGLSFLIPAETTVFGYSNENGADFTVLAGDWGLGADLEWGLYLNKRSAPGRFFVAPGVKLGYYRAATSIKYLYKTNYEATYTANYLNAVPYLKLWMGLPVNVGKVRTKWYISLSLKTVFAYFLNGREVVKEGAQTSEMDVIPYAFPVQDPLRIIDQEVVWYWDKSQAPPNSQEVRLSSGGIGVELSLGCSFSF